MTVELDESKASDEIYAIKFLIKAYSLLYIPLNTIKYQMGYLLDSSAPKM